MNWYVRGKLEGYEVTNYNNESYLFKTVEWAELCKQHFDRLDSINAKKIDNIEYTASSKFLRMPEQSDWKCYLFGSKGEGITWVPSKGNEPNWFWRKMQYLVFGNKWVRNEL